MGRTHRIGTVETLKVKSSGRRLYVNLDADLVLAYGIQTGDILKVEIKERIKPDQPGPNRPEPGKGRMD